MASESEDRRLQLELSHAAFNFFMWSLHQKTPLADIAALAEELTTTANKMLMAYYHAKGIPMETDNA